MDTGELPNDTGTGTGKAHRKILLLSQHEIYCMGVICAVGFVDCKVLFLLFAGSTMNGIVSRDSQQNQLETHIVLKEKPPTLVPPRHLCCALQTNEKLPLKVQKFVQSREKVMNGVEVDCVALGQGSCIPLLRNETRANYEYRYTPA